MITSNANAFDGPDLTLDAIRDAMAAVAALRPKAMTIYTSRNAQAGTALAVDTERALLYFMAHVDMKVLEARAAKEAGPPTGLPSLQTSILGAPIIDLDALEGMALFDLFTTLPPEVALNPEFRRIFGWPPL